MGTYVCKQAEADRKWVVIDAAGQTLGRLSTHVGRMLMGKHRPTYTPHADTGDFVVVINAEKGHLTGRKLGKKFYRLHTRYPRGLQQVAPGRVLEAKATRGI